MEAPHGIHPKGRLTLPAIIIYTESGICHSFFSPILSDLVYIATEVLEVDADKFASMIFSLDRGVHSVVIDAPTYQQYMKEQGAVKND